MAIQKDIVINRKEYQNIRKMDHNQMNAYLQEIYKNGYTDGVKSVPGIDIAEVRKTLLSVKGLGEKRVEAVLAALEKEMKSEKN
nr:MAG TPA: putative DNA-3-methyladenine glycosylase 2 [Caudoviricetes sp.]